MKHIPLRGWHPQEVCWSSWWIAVVPRWRSRERIVEALSLCLARFLVVCLSAVLWTFSDDSPSLSLSLLLFSLLLPTTHSHTTLAWTSVVRSRPGTKDFECLSLRFFFETSFIDSRRAEDELIKYLFLFFTRLRTKGVGEERVGKGRE
jgi:hypothetical protein